MIVRHASRTLPRSFHRVDASRDLFSFWLSCSWSSRRPCKTSLWDFKQKGSLLPQGSLSSTSAKLKNSKRPGCKPTVSTSRGEHQCSNQRLYETEIKIIL